MRITSYLTAELITTGESQGDWFWISVFFALMWGLAMFIIEMKNREIKKLRGKNGKRKEKGINSI